MFQQHTHLGNIRSASHLRTSVGDKKHKDKKLFFLSGSQNCARFAIAPSYRNATFGDDVRVNYFQMLATSLPHAPIAVDGFRFRSDP